MLNRSNIAEGRDSIVKHILILEPYYGGSHKFFLKGLQKNIRAEYTVFSLPARKWKMRMQLSAPWFIKKIGDLPPSKRDFDVVLCSTFVDVAVLKALLVNITGWDRKIPIVTYFHENQFIYPQQNVGENNFQFTSINFNSGMASDRIAFNSSFNCASFLAGCQRIIKSATDMKMANVVAQLEAKSSVIYPGIDFDEFNGIKGGKKNDIPVIVWNHRWEHDKNPEEFFKALLELEALGHDFRLIILGQSFKNYPECFTWARQYLSQKIIHSGFVESYLQYVALLQQGDIVVSTALHEFFGIAIVEAVGAGCYPVLPNRLSYPELFSPKYLYNEGELVAMLSNLLSSKSFRLSSHTKETITEKFSWNSLQEQYRSWLFKGVNG